MPTKIPCSVSWCTRPKQTGGLCHMHYQRKRNGYDLEAPIQPRYGNATCAAGDCDRKAKSLGLCRAHYQRLKNGRDMDMPIQQRNPGPCEIKGCDRQGEGRGLCELHRRRLRTGVPMDQPVRGYGTYRHKNRDGYVLLRSNQITGARKSNGYVLEHRWKMEQIIGRPLRPGETVHHVNGVKDDNRAENLELWVSSHPYGQRVQDLLVWAREIITDYGKIEDTLFSQAPPPQS